MSAPLRLTLYDAAPGDAPLRLGPGTWFVYAPEGAVTVASAGDETPLAADEGAFAPAAAQLAGPGRAWLYRVAPAGAPDPDGAAVVRSHRLHPGFAAPYLVRADRIESPPGAATPRHGHRGPGLRRLVFGCLLAEIGDTVERIEAGGAWFETGHDMVVGTNIGGTGAAFVRVMVLPAELAGGRSSFMPADAAEAAKPRAVDNRLFGEVMLDAAGHRDEGGGHPGSGGHGQL